MKHPPMLAREGQSKGTPRSYALTLSSYFKDDNGLV